MDSQLGFDAVNSDRPGKRHVGQCSGPARCQLPWSPWGCCADRQCMLLPLVVGGGIACQCSHWRLGTWAWLTTVWLTLVSMLCRGQGDTVAPGEQRPLSGRIFPGLRSSLPGASQKPGLFLGKVNRFLHATLSLATHSPWGPPRAVWMFGH